MQAWELIPTADADRENPDRTVTHRLKVPGGWLYRLTTRHTATATMCFVPADPDAEE
jgi:hypothetical protein